MSRFIGALGALFLATALFASASAHDADEFTFTGEAVDACHETGATWGVTWTITDDPDANPFGIIDADTSDGQDVTFSPLESDVGDGYIPPGDSAEASTVHAASVASVVLTVEHDVTNGPNTFWRVTVDRPEPCDTASIAVRKNVIGVANDPTGFNVDIEGGAADITNLDEGDGFVVRSDLDPGLYILTEYAIPSGYEFVEWICISDQKLADIDEDDESVAIVLRAAEDVECVLVNRPKLATATPTPTSTPAATSTPAPTATPIPAPAVVVPNIIVNPPNVNVTIPPVAPQAAPAAATSSTVGIAPSSTIKPPSTGSGGLLTIPCGWEYVQEYVSGYYSYEYRGWGRWVFTWHPGHYVQVWTYVC